MKLRSAASAFVLILLCTISAPAQSLDERPGATGEWGFRPADDAVTRRNPPSFSWRPQKNAATYSIQIARDDAFTEIAYQHAAIAFNVHCPTQSLKSGRWFWRFRAHDGSGNASDWSQVRAFDVAADAVSFPLPDRDELVARVPDGHPRLFVRPESIAELRSQLLGTNECDALLKRCASILADPPPTEEPSKYTKDMIRGSDPWRAVWWGNRKYTIAVLDNAATLGFAYQLTGESQYGDEAKRLLMEAAAWDPKGSTGYRYNDEAGMPYAYHFSRTYTFVNDLLSEDEKAACRRVMRVRGKEMYAHLNPRHLWRPYSSHSNRAWHFLGEVAIAFHGEIPEADDWLWFAVNVFANVYPVWSDDDGGWHEGAAYWTSYLGRFTWWADVMREAVGLNAFELPFFSRAGDFGLYLMPPGTVGGGFGDLNTTVESKRFHELMTTFAAQAGNPYWQWYVDQHGGPLWKNDFISLLRRSRSTVQARPPATLASSKLFEGTGQAMLNSNLLDGTDNVRVVFKSSEFGTQSHGYESQNSFVMSAFGMPLLIRSGRRDSYGSTHHKEWMWRTKSVNNILINGKGQTPHSAKARGTITEFHTSPVLDFVEGESSRAYGGAAVLCRRSLLFLKPDLVVIVDRVIPKEPSTIQLLLHAPTPFEISEGSMAIRNEDAACVLSVSAEHMFHVSSTDAFDPAPRPRVKLTQYHYTASTVEPVDECTWVTVVRPHRTTEAPPSFLVERDSATNITTIGADVDGREVVVVVDPATGTIRAEYSDEGESMRAWSSSPD